MPILGNNQCTSHNLHHCNNNTLFINLLYIYIVLIIIITYVYIACYRYKVQNVLNSIKY